MKFAFIVFLKEDFKTINKVFGISLKFLKTLTVLLENKYSNYFPSLYHHCIAQKLYLSSPSTFAEHFIFSNDVDLSKNPFLLLLSWIELIFNVFCCSFLFGYQINFNFLFCSQKYFSNCFFLFYSNLFVLLFINQR